MTFSAISHTFRLSLLLCLLTAAPANADPSTLVQTTAQVIHLAMTPATAAPPAQPDEKPATFDASPLELDSQRFNFQRDWWKYSIMLIVVAGCSCLLLKVVKQILSFLIILVCLAASAGISYLIGPALEPLLKQCIPGLGDSFFPPIFWAYVLAFLVAYATATLIVHFVRKPADNGDSGKGNSK